MHQRSEWAEGVEAPESQDSRSKARPPSYEAAVVAVNTSEPRTAQRTAHPARLQDGPAVACPRVLDLDRDLVGGMSVQPFLASDAKCLNEAGKLHPGFCQENIPVHGLR